MMLFAVYHRYAANAINAAVSGTIRGDTLTLSAGTFTASAGA